MLLKSCKTWTVEITAQTIRKCLLEADFGLEDKSCDAHELTHCEESEVNESVNKERKITKLKALYQIMYYNIHKGWCRLPLRLMVAHNIYDKCKSQELITSLNQIGVCISYNEIQKKRKSLAHYTFKQGEDWGVPIPSHFAKENFTIVVLDNFDHTDRSSTSGMLSNHDTVTVLFQEKPKVLPSKPKKSDICIQQSKQSNKLCSRGKRELILPETFTVLQEKPNRPRVNRVIDVLNFVLSVIHFGQNLSDADALISTWARCQSLLSGRTSSIWQVGFLPYLPYPVTKYDTVFTALYKLANVANQLQQFSWSSLNIFEIITSDGWFPHGKSCHSLCRKISQR